MVNQSDVGVVNATISDVLVANETIFRALWSE